MANIPRQQKKTATPATRFLFIGERLLSKHLFFGIFRFFGFACPQTGKVRHPYARQAL
jgi:hypothetical protein